jgi:hypothetical protein
VEKKATLSLAELEAEAEEDDDFVEEEEEEEEEVYNPLKLPLGWDGKPIPYWLYKLHGLNLEFTCEICGNYSYWGRRAYEKHFKEYRHQHGMRCLKIPNTRAFSEVSGEKICILFYRLRGGGVGGGGEKGEDEKKFFFVLGVRLASRPRTVNRNRLDDLFCFLAGDDATLHWARMDYLNNPLTHTHLGPRKPAT